MSSQNRPNSSTEPPRYAGEILLPGAQFEAFLHDWSAPEPEPAEYRVVCHTGVEEIHRGRRVSLDRLLGFLCREGPDAPPLMRPDEPAWDLVVFDRDHQAVAIIRKAHDGSRAVRVDFDRLAEAEDGAG